MTNVNVQILHSLLTFCIVFRVIGCKADLDDKKLIFLAEHDLARERIELLPSGSFTHAVKLKDLPKEVVTEGKWYYSEDKSSIIFDSNFMIVVDGHGKFNSAFESIADGIVSLPIYRWFGNILLGSDEVVLYKLLK